MIGDEEKIKVCVFSWLYYLNDYRKINNITYDIKYFKNMIWVERSGHYKFSIENVKNVRFYSNKKCYKREWKLFYKKN